MTDQDKAILHEREHQIWGYGHGPALVLVDLYRWFLGDQRHPIVEAMKSWAGACGPQAWDAFPHLKRLLAAARAAKIPIVHITGLDPSESGVAGWSDNPKRTRFGVANDATMTEKLRRRFEIVDEVSPLSGEAVLRKAAPSAFFGTLLLAHLQAQNVDRISLRGESPSGCVRAS